jgi:hypothetical protein
VKIEVLNKYLQLHNVIVTTGKSTSKLKLIILKGTQMPNSPNSLCAKYSSHFNEFSGAIFLAKW